REVMAKFLEWSSGQATWSGGQDVGVVAKMLEWWPRVLSGGQGSCLGLKGRIFNERAWLFLDSQY
ncbi:hypothetical protein Tco_0301796, partial [Tanacetum coccineum]